MRKQGPIFDAFLFYRIGPSPARALRIAQIQLRLLVLIAGEKGGIKRPHGRFSALVLCLVDGLVGQELIEAVIVA